MRFRAVVTMLTAPLAAFVLACGAGTSGTSTSGGAAPAAGSTSKAAVATVKAGETLNLVEDFFGTKTKAAIALTNVRFGVKPKNQFDVPQRGQFIVVDVAVTVTEGKFSIYSGSFKLVAADGTVYDTSSMVGVTQLTANDLTPGQKSAGSVVFDAAKGAEKGGRIALKNVLADGDAGYWTL